MKENINKNSLTCMENNRNTNMKGVWREPSGVLLRWGSRKTVMLSSLGTC